MGAVADRRKGYPTARVLETFSTSRKSRWRACVGDRDRGDGRPRSTQTEEGWGAERAAGPCGLLYLPAYYYAREYDPLQRYS